MAVQLKSRSFLMSVVGAFAAGIIFWGGFNTAMELTNREAFCISCHEMRDNVYREYKETVHYTNRTGVRATCPDCHVPDEWVHMLARKVRATNELFHAIRGSIDTREKFLAKRLGLAGKVWKSMRDSDSRECRNCHGYRYMDPREQGTGARAQHRRGREQGKTCIDCHMGIAHRLPEEFVASEHERYERENVPCADCHTGVAAAPSGEDWSLEGEDDKKGGLVRSE